MRLTDCFVELVAYVAYFLKSAAQRQPSFERVRSDIHRLLAQSDGCLQKGHFSRGDYDEARFAICAWVDEMILGSAWQEKAKWTREQLQRVYFQTFNAGEEFFDRLNKLGPHQNEVREVYYICLVMGFAGRYCNEGDEFLLENLKESNLKILTGSSLGLPPLEKGELFPEAYQQETAEGASQPPVSWFTPFTIGCMAVPVILFIMLYIVCWFFLDRQVQELIELI